MQTSRLIDKDPTVELVGLPPYSDTPITMLRNRSVLDARSKGCHYLLMIDSDMDPDTPYEGSEPFWPVAWEFMMNRREWEEGRKVIELNDGRKCLATSDSKYAPATIAAPYCGPSPDQCCYVFEWKGRGSRHPNPDFQLGMVPRESAAIRTGIQEAAALPTGLILYDLRVFDVLPPPWFEYEYADPPFNSQKCTTEDVYQTRNASILGLPQYCAWSSWASHMKTERVGKPQIVTRDQVHHSLRSAVLRGVDSDDRLVVLDGKEETDARESD